MLAARRLTRAFTQAHLDSKYQIRLNLEDAPLDHHKRQLLNAALAHVPSLGWSRNSLVKASEELGYTPVTHGILERGPIELVEHFVGKSTAELKAHSQNNDFKQYLRLIQAWDNRKDSTLDSASPIDDCAVYQAVASGELVDEIWYLAGDRSLDFNWYSKRGLLAGVYTSTEMFMALDSSPDFQNTFKFLDRRLADVGVVGKTVGEASAMLDYGFKTISSVIASKTNY